MVQRLRIIVHVCHNDTDDTAECKEAESEYDFGKEFIYSDPMYSNQGMAGTCVRHAVGKAIHNVIIKLTGGKIFIQT